MIYVFDKRYNDYKAFKRFSEYQMCFVTRIKDNTVYESIYQNIIGININIGFLQDEIIELILKDDN